MPDKERLKSVMLPADLVDRFAEYARSRERSVRAQMRLLMEEAIASSHYRVRKVGSARWLLHSWPFDSEEAEEALRLLKVVEGRKHERGDHDDHLLYPRAGIEVLRPKDWLGQLEQAAR